MDLEALPLASVWKADEFIIFSRNFGSTFPVSGKTGTAEVGDGEDQRRDNSLFVAYGRNRTLTAAPEPASMALAGLGAIGVHAAARRGRR